MAGSVASASQRFFITSPTQLDHWTNYLDQQRRVIEPHENEMSVFFKDDWKIRPSFTLNVGVRWQYYGAPYEGQGLTIRPQGGQDGLALFGVSGRSFSNWMNPNNGVDTSLQTQMEFVGPKTSKPGDSIFQRTTTISDLLSASPGNCLGLEKEKRTSAAATRSATPEAAMRATFRTSYSQRPGSSVT
jgi:hypothetical protein